MAVGHVKSILKHVLPRPFLNFYYAYNAIIALYPRTCPICGYTGYFTNFGSPPRADARCPKCSSFERHRLFWLWFKKNQMQIKEPILHFAPEAILQQKFREYFTNYKTADAFNSADYRIHIENIPFPTASIATVICNHVLEHVADDMKALREIYRILLDDGRFIVSVPIIEGWERTYENQDITDPILRTVHFGRFDHVRYYGRDFRDRLKNAGFVFDEIAADGETVVRHGLLRGEKLFICRKS